MTQITQKWNGNEKSETMQILYNAQKLLSENISKARLNFAHTLPEKIEIFIYIDSSFAVSHCKTSQLVFVIMLLNSRN